PWAPSSSSPTAGRAREGSAMPSARAERRAPAADGPALRRLARVCGVQTRYVDQLGARRAARPEAVAAVLRAMGVPIESAADAGDALRAREAERAARACEPVAVAWNRAPASVALALPGVAAGAPVRCELRLEDGR